MPNENESTIRTPRRSSITLGILLRQNEIESNCFLYSDDDGVYLLNNVERDSKHAIHGFRIESSPQSIPYNFTMSTPNIFKRSRFIQVLKQLNIVGAKNVMIGNSYNIFCQAAESLEDTVNEPEIIRAATDACGTEQYIGEINIYDADTVQRGPNVEIIRQTAQVLNAIEGQTSLTEQESQTTKPEKQNRVRLGVAVIVCCSIVVGCGIMFQILYQPRSKQRIECDNPISYVIQLRITEWWYKTRYDWNAREPIFEKRTFLKPPIYFVVVGHSISNYCDEEIACKENILAMQIKDQIHKEVADIVPNYIVSANGLVFEGRGANVQGAMLPKHNEYAISILFLGDYERNQTCIEQFNHLKRVLDELQNEGILASSYSLLGECQISEMPQTSPGINVMNELREMDYWYSEKTEHCVGMSETIIDLIIQDMDG